MGGYGHVSRIRALVAALTVGGVDAVVFTDRAFEAGVRAAGGRFADLYAGRSPDGGDDSSSPVPCRNVTFAARAAAELVVEAAAFRPSLVVTDTFAVVGSVVAKALDLPCVNVCSGHDLHPERFLAALRDDPRLAVSARCHEAVAVLRERFGIADASPFSYFTSVSSSLNIYCEPPDFLSETTRERLEPLAYFGSLPAPAEAGPRGAARRRPPLRPRGRVRVYASFGTAAWPYYEAEALAALGQIADLIATHPEMIATISLGGAPLSDAAVTGLRRHNVSVARYVDQWRVLSEADVFITHHGLNSTHEAIFHQVPMISYPLFWDQPGLARTAQRLDLAVPLGTAPRAALDRDQVESCFAALAASRERLLAGLERAYRWELDVIEARPEVVRRIVELA